MKENRRIHLKYYFYQTVFVFCAILSNLHLGAISICNYPCEPGGEYIHWFTGPIFTPNPRALPQTQPAIELVIFTSKTYGVYNNDWSKKNVPTIWSIGPYIDFQYSFNELIGIEFIGSTASNFCEKKMATYLRDTIFRTGFQVSRDCYDSWIPDFRVLLQETFPTGKYDRLSPDKKGVDLTGQGSFLTGIHLAAQKIFKLPSSHCLSLRGDIGYQISSSVKVDGYNFYFTSRKTNGRVKPGSIFVGFLTGEYSLSSKWNICCENSFQYQKSGHFKGKSRRTNGNANKKFKTKVASIAQLVIAPEIEHTFTKNIGIIFGSAITLAGKNAPAYYSAFLSAACLF